MPIPTSIAAATQVSLNGLYNTTGNYTNGSTFNRRAGLDGTGNAYSANLLGTRITVGGRGFNLRPGNMTNVVSGIGQSVILPSGKY